MSPAILRFGGRCRTITNTAAIAFQHFPFFFPTGTHLSLEMDVVKGHHGCLFFCFFLLTNSVECSFRDKWNRPCLSPKKKRKEKDDPAGTCFLFLLVRVIPKTMRHLWAHRSERLGKRHSCWLLFSHRWLGPVSTYGTASDTHTHTHTHTTRDVSLLGRWPIPKKEEPKKKIKIKIIKQFQMKKKKFQESWNESGRGRAALCDE